MTARITRLRRTLLCQNILLNIQHILSFNENYGKYIYLSDESKKKAFEFQFDTRKLNFDDSKNLDELKSIFKNELQLLEEIKTKIVEPKFIYILYRDFYTSDDVKIKILEEIKDEKRILEEAWGFFYSNKRYFEKF